MIKALIVDDEKRARETIRNIIKLYCPQVEVAGEASDVRSAREAIAQHKPSLVLLDINMPGGTGFDLLGQFGADGPKVIFITAYQEYAVKAFRFSALDYILKPVNPDELVEAVRKASEVIGKESMDLKLQAFISNMENITREVKKIVLNTSDSIHVVNVPEIVRCQSDSNYTEFYLNNGKKILVSSTLKDFDEMLSSYRFFRAHQSHLVNIDYIERYEKKEGGYLVMKDKSTVPVSVRKKETLIALLDNI